jgi:hypothetical protein
MKKASILFTGLLFLLSSIYSNAQTKSAPDYFIGKWHVRIAGTPLGDLNRFYIFEKKGDSLSGHVQDATTGAEVAKYTKVELKMNQVTVYYSASGYDVNIVFTKKDDDHITGNLLGMFDAPGERVKL